MAKEGENRVASLAIHQVSIFLLSILKSSCEFLADKQKIGREKKSPWRRAQNCFTLF